MLEELRLASVGGFRSKHDDALDTISMLALINAFPPSEENTWMDSTYRSNPEETNYDSAYICLIGLITFLVCSTKPKGNKPCVLVFISLTNCVGVELLPTCLGTKG